MLNQDIGDFMVMDFHLERARETQSTRSKRERAVDAEKRAPVTTDFGRWANDKDDLDFPGIDTPRESPNLLPKDLKQTQKPRLTPRARDEAPVAPKEESIEDKKAEFAARDAPVFPREAFGMEASAASELGGFDFSTGEEVSPTNEPKAPPGETATDIDIR